MATFRSLHQSGNPFILANAWDIGSAKLLAALGAEAIATTSAGHAFTLGVKDMGDIKRDQAIQHAAELADATNLPVSGDFENGFGHSPGMVAETVKLAAQSGLAGCSIEDSQLPSSEPYERSVAIERIEAAIDAAHQSKHDFVLTARADGVMNAHYDMKEAIARIKAYAHAGADVVYVPLPPDMEALKTVCASVECPVNALVAGDFCTQTRQQFANVGVARLSLGSSLARITHAAIFDAGKAMFANGDFSALSVGIAGSTIEAMFDQVK